MSRFLGISLLILTLGYSSSYACTTTDKLRVFSPDVELITLFFYINNSRKESIRMGITEDPDQDIPVFTLFGCIEYQDVDIRTADNWRPESCAPLTQLWLPLYSKNKDNEVVDNFKTSIKTHLESYLSNHSWDPATQRSLMLLNGGLNLTVGYGLQFYASKFKPVTRTSKALRWGARGAGWTLVIWSLWGGAIDLVGLSSEDSRFLAIDELTQLIQGMEDNHFFSLDGSELSENFRPTQVNKTVSMIKKSIKKASIETYKHYCGNN